MANDRVSALQTYLDQQLPGPIADARRVSSLLADCWDELAGHDDTSMRADKLWRIETPVWQPPHLQFQIERHGQTVNGSSRATV